MSKTKNEFPPQVHERAVRLVPETEGQHASCWQVPRVRLGVEPHCRAERRPAFPGPAQRHGAIRDPQIHTTRLDNRQHLLRAPRDRLALGLATSAMIPTVRSFASDISNARAPVQ
jgi:hypothetical protein